MALLTEPEDFSLAPELGTELTEWSTVLPKHHSLTKLIMKSTSIKVIVECNSRVKLQSPPVSKPSLKATTAQSWMKRWNMEEEERSPPTQRPRMHRRAPTPSNPWHTRDLHARHHSLLVKRKGRGGASLGLPLHRLGILHG
ncbi:unnamed protein product [Musa hybrid cultivar]